MSAIAAEPISLLPILEELYESGKTTHELAEAAFEAAGEEENRQAAIKGWQDAFRVFEADTWRQSDAASEPSKRSGHSNKSGRYSKGERPDRFFRLTVADNEGNRYKLGDLSRDLCEQLKGEYRERERQGAAGRKFFAELAAELKRTGKETVAELGSERVAAMKRECGYRERG